MTTPTRSYDLTFDRIYGTRPGVRPPTPPWVPVPLAQITWGGLNINPGNTVNEFTGDEFTAIVEDITGWYDSPPLNGNDATRALADGSAWGPKVLGPRTIAVTGSAAGPRPALMDWRDQLAQRACDRNTAEFTVEDPWLGQTLAAITRAGTEQFAWTPLSRWAFRWTVTLTAGDPRLYAQDWQQVRLTCTTAADTGRLYPRFYTGGEPDYEGWQYRDQYPPGSAGWLTNAGNAPAPVTALWSGELAASRLTDDALLQVNMALVGPGVSIWLDTESLIAEAIGGEARPQYVLPGSVPMTIPPKSTVRWHLYSEGPGAVALSWRSAWL